MSINNGRPALTPAMFLWELTAVCSRHGLAVSTSNPSASLHYAEQLMRSLGLTVPGVPPAAIEAPAPAATTTELPRVGANPPKERWDSFTSALPRGTDAGMGAVRPHPLDRPAGFLRGSHRPGAPRALRSVDEPGGPA